MDDEGADRGVAASLARHGINAPREQLASAAARGGRFSRMFGNLPSRDPGDDAVKALYEKLVNDGLSDLKGSTVPSVPAGYTYLAQFVDHDITFDPTSRLGHDNDPLALANFRTPRLDLDSLYGSGPLDQPFLYDWSCEPSGVKLLVGHNPPGDSENPLARDDLPRNQAGRALIGDARNDENRITSQLHLLFIRFHNNVVEHLCEHCSQLKGAELFDEARRIVRWHYQWIVVHDLLEHLVGPIAGKVLVSAPDGGAPTVRRKYYSWQDEPSIPVEFSAAAFRLGHSMVRPRYVTSHEHLHGVDIMPAGGHLDLGGFSRLPKTLEIEWERFFEMHPGTTDPHRLPQPRLLIDTHITEPLFSLPPDGAALPDLNLRRGRALGLPAGADVAHLMGEVPLSHDELELDDPLFTPTIRDALRHATPLWYYLLCEATSRGQNGKYLGPIAGTIVAEVLVGLLEGDPQSYLRQYPAWTPHLEAAHAGRFTMPDLVNFAGGKIGPP